MNKPIIALLTGVLLSFVAVGGWVWYARNLRPSKPVVRTAHFKPIPLLYTIQTVVKGDEVEVKNVEEGVFLVVPKEWDITKIYAKEKDPLLLGADLIAPGVPYISADLFKFDNEEKLSLAEWVRQYGHTMWFNQYINKEDLKIVIWKGRTAYYSTGKNWKDIPHGEPGSDYEDESDIPNDKSIAFTFYIQKINSPEIFSFRCAAEGDNFKEYIPQCWTLWKEKLFLP